MPFLKKLGANIGGALVDAGSQALGGALGRAAGKLPPILRGPVKGLIGDVFGGGAAGQGARKSPIKVSETKYLKDWRASLTWPNTDKYAETDIFKFLPQKDGAPVVYWPFTPTVSINYTANYESIHTQQTNIATPAYSNSNVADITVAGEFVAGTIADANYVYAAIHFLKSATKSFNMADKAGLRGAPPPVLKFNYLGEGGFKDMPVVITGFNMSYPKEVDYVSTGFNKENSMVPAECLIQVTLMPAYSRVDLVGGDDPKKRYSTEAFIKGDLISGGHF